MIKKIIKFCIFTTMLSVVICIGFDFKTAIATEGPPLLIRSLGIPAEEDMDDLPLLNIYEKAKREDIIPGVNNRLMMSLHSLKKAYGTDEDILVMVRILPVDDKDEDIFLNIENFYFDLFNLEIVNLDTAKQVPSSALEEKVKSANHTLKDMAKIKEETGVFRLNRQGFFNNLLFFYGLKDFGFGNLPKGKYSITAVYRNNYQKINEFTCWTGKIKSNNIVIHVIDVDYQ